MSTGRSDGSRSNLISLPDEIDVVLVNPQGFQLSGDAAEGFPQGDVLQVYLFEFAGCLRQVLEALERDGDHAPVVKLLGCKTLPDLTRGGSIIFHLPGHVLKLSERTPSSFMVPQTAIDFRDFFGSLPLDQKIIVPEIPSIVNVCWAMSGRESGQVLHRHMPKGFKGKTLWVAPHQAGVPMNEFMKGTQEVVSYQDILAVLKNVAQALKMAHDREVCHGDVKPGNVFVKKDPSGRCHGKLFDWETAMRFGATAVNENTPLYAMSTPEYAMSTYLPKDATLSVNYTYDMLALGATILRVCMGKNVKEVTKIKAILDGLKMAINQARSLGRVHPIEAVLPANFVPDVKRKLAKLIYDLVQADSGLVPNARQVIARIEGLIASL